MIYGLRVFGSENVNDEQILVYDGGATAHSEYETYKVAITLPNERI